MAKFTGFWAPAIIVLGLSAGILFAVGHHLFYSSLRGQPPPPVTADVSAFEISRQELNIAAGTMFAFLVKTGLSAALSTAYIQLLWRAIKHGPAEIRVSSLDYLTSALFNPFSLFRMWTWIRYPLLLAVAVLVWLLPLSTIVPPATLSIQTAPIVPPPSSMEVVPSANYASMAYLQNMSMVGTELIPPVYSTFEYNGPSAQVLGTTGSIVTSGSISPAEAPSLNASWTLDFTGPSLDCSPVEDSPALATLKEKLFQYANASTGNTNIAYLSWSAGLGTGSDVNCQGDPLLIPFIDVPTNASQLVNTGCIAGEYGPSNVSAAFYLALIPLANERYREINFTGSVFAQCELSSSVYQTNFSFVNGNQTLNYSTQSLGGPASPALEFVTFQWNPLYGTNSTPSPHNISTSPDLTPKELLTRLSHQAIFDAFQQQFSGYVILDAPGSGGQGDATINTKVLTTMIGKRSEFEYLLPNSESSVGFPIAWLEWPNGTLITGLEPTAQPNESETLFESIEHLFEKTVISLMSSQELQIAQTSPFAPPLVNVTRNDYATLYVYSAAKIWLSYSLGIAITVLTALLGVWAMLANNASYSLHVSTILRVGRDAKLSREIRVEDRGGKNPLPDYLAEAKIRLGGGGVVGHGEASTKEVAAAEGSPEPDTGSPLLDKTTTTMMAPNLLSAEPTYYGGKRPGVHSRDRSSGSISSYM